jgi:hypothetical protein
MKGGNGSLRYLVARKGGRGIVLFPFGREPDDGRLKALAILGLSR